MQLGQAHRWNDVARLTGLGSSNELGVGTAKFLLCADSKDPQGLLGYSDAPSLPVYGIIGCYGMCSTAPAAEMGRDESSSVILSKVFLLAVTSSRVQQN